MIAMPEPDRSVLDRRAEIVEALRRIVPGEGVIDRQSDLTSWVVVLKRLVQDKRIRKIFAFANNHYAGHAPATVQQFWELWNRKNPAATAPGQFSEK